VPGLGADAATVNPLLGRDALEPLAMEAEKHGAGLFVLVRTSNPGAADVQDLRGPGGPVWESLAAMVADLGLGAVTGATVPEHLVRLRELMPRAVFLLPGVGAQGGRAEHLAPAFRPRAHNGLVTASRSIVNAFADAADPQADPAAAAAEAATRLRASAWAASGN
jgi:orotidine-5'-phosphate decarboxylase